MRKRGGVSVGGVYRETGRSFLGSARRCWTVDAVKTSVDGQAHAIITSLDFLRTQKTLSTAVLLDKSRYELLADDVVNQQAVLLDAR
jgi:hypothetical protein